MNAASMVDNLLSVRAKPRQMPSCIDIVESWIRVNRAGTTTAVRRYSVEHKDATVLAQLVAILGKLEQARRLPDRQDEFGVSEHQFRLNAPLAEAEVAAFEERHGVRLPDDYRLFLLLAGNGGAGPYYGIAPLSEWDYWFEEEAESPGFLASPCPLAPAPALLQAWHAAAERAKQRSQGSIQPGASPGVEWSQFVPGNWEAWGHGTIHICDQGCTFSARLIVSGEARGRIVYLDSQGWNPPYFVRDRNFLDWYERWLDTFLTGRPLGWFGLDNPEHE
jgi:hypothetical protein